MKSKKLPLLVAGVALVLLGGQIPYLAIDFRLREAAWDTPGLVAVMPAVKIALAAAGVVLAAICGLWTLRRERSTPIALAAGGTALFAAYSILPLSMNSAVLTFAMAVGLAGFWLAARAAGGGGAGGAWSRMLAGSWRRVLGLPVASWRCLLFSTGLVLNLLVAGFVFDFRPCIIDTLDQVFQARIFLEGRFTAAAPPVPRAFEFLYMIIRDGHWYSHYPPGHPLLLAAGLTAGASWLIGPLLGAGIPVLLHAVGRTLWSERTGRVAGLLGLAAPYIHLMAGSHMSHTSCAFFLLLGTLGLAHLLRGGGVGWALTTGASFGYALITRPYPAFAVSGAAALGFLWAATRTRRVRFRVAPLAVLAAAVPVALLLYYNLKTNGHPLVFGYNITQGPLHKLGFGLRRMNETVREFTLPEAIKQTGYHLNGLNVFALGTSVPAVLLLPWTFFARRRHPFEWPVLVLAAAPVAAFFVYPFTDFVLGPRLVFASIPFAILLAARSLVRRRRVDGGVLPRVSGPVLVTLLFLPALPDLAGAMEFNARLMRAGHDRIEAAAGRGRIGRGLVLCDDAVFDRYGFGRLHPALPPDRPVFARDVNSAELVRRFPGRSVFRLAFRAPRDVRLERHIEPCLDLYDLVAARSAELEDCRGIQTATQRLDLGPIRDETHKLLFGYRTPAGVRLRVTVPAHAFLRFSSIVHPDAWANGSDGVTFRVRVQTAAMARPVTLFDEYLGRDRPPLDLLDREVDLGPFAGAGVRLWVEALPGPAGDSRADVFDISNLRIVRRLEP